MVDVSVGVRVGLGMSYNCNYAIGFQQRVEVLEELQSEERNWLSAAGEDIMYYVVEFAVCRVDKFFSVSDCISDDRCVISRQLEIFGGELMHDRVDFHHSAIDTMSN